VESANASGVFKPVTLRGSGQYRMRFRDRTSAPFAAKAGDLVTVAVDLKQALNGSE